MNWRRLGSRPLPDRDRRIAFLFAAVVLSVSAAVLLAIPDGGRDTAAPTPQLQSPPPAPAAPSRPPVAAGRVARRFMADYLRFVYGGGSGALRGAAPALAARLRRTRTRIPPGAREREPEVVSIDLRELGAELVAATVRVRDGAIGYGVALGIERQLGRWRVVRVGAE